MLVYSDIYNTIVTYTKDVVGIYTIICPHYNTTIVTTLLTCNFTLVSVNNYEIKWSSV